MKELPPLVRAHLSPGVAASEEGAAWASGLSDRIEELRRRWSIVALGAIGDGRNDGLASWVAAATLASGTPAVLKLGFPHLEGRDEIDGLAFWAGGPTVRLLAADRAANAMLLERCAPGHSLKGRPEPEQDEVIAGLLRGLWRAPPPSHPFRPLAELTVHLRACREAEVIDAVAGAETVADADADAAADPRLPAALDELDALAVPRPTDRVLATDLHAGNVLAAGGGTWRIIDPKPFVGDPAFDVTQHLLNCPARLCDDPLGLVRRVADLAGVDGARVRRWLRARIVAEAGWLDAEGMEDVVDALGIRRTEPGDPRVYHRTIPAAGDPASSNGASDP